MPDDDNGYLTKADVLKDHETRIRLVEADINGIKWATRALVVVNLPIAIAIVAKVLTG